MLSVVACYGIEINFHYHDKNRRHNWSRFVLDVQGEPLHLLNFSDMDQALVWINHVVNMSGVYHGDKHFYITRGHVKIWLDIVTDIALNNILPVHLETNKGILHYHFLTIEEREEFVKNLINKNY
jgi:hypothetical protein